MRLRIQVQVLGRDPGAPEIGALQEESRTSPRVRALLSRRDAAGRLDLA